MVTKEEWDALDKKIKAWEERHLKQTAEKARKAADQVTEDGKVDWRDLQKPTTI